jgi:hypothetical protein
MHEIEGVAAEIDSTADRIRAHLKPELLAQSGVAYARA